MGIAGTFRDWLLHCFGTGHFSGITLGGWLRLLRDNGFRVFPSFWGRAATITAVSVANSIVAQTEAVRLGRRWRRVQIQSPLFVIGHYRSGTTLLHNLLSIDQRFASPSLMDCSNPSTFLTASPVIEWVGRILPSSRPMDGVVWHVGMPAEDELAAGLLSGYSPYFAMSFARHADKYDRFLTFEEAKSWQARRWQRSLRWFLRKVSLKYEGKPLILKSPPHTARIKLLLDLFPDAKFVHIHREPFRVFQSTMHLYRSLMPWLRLQRWSDRDLQTLEDRVIRNYRQLYLAYFAQRELIPEGHLCEVSYESLDRDPIGTMAAIYGALNLPDFDAVASPLKEYVNSLHGYRKNRFPDLRVDLKQRIVESWRFCFESWDYPTELPPCSAPNEESNESLKVPSSRETSRTVEPLAEPIRHEAARVIPPEPAAPLTVESS